MAVFSPKSNRLKSSQVLVRMVAVTLPQNCPPIVLFVHTTDVYLVSHSFLDHVPVCKFFVWCMAILHVVYPRTGSLRIGILICLHDWWTALCLGEAQAVRGLNHVPQNLHGPQRVEYPAHGLWRLHICCLCRPISHHLVGHPALHSLLSCAVKTDIITQTSSHLGRSDLSLSR